MNLRLLTLLSLVFSLSCIYAQQIDSNAFKKQPDDTATYNKIKKLYGSKNSELIIDEAQALLKILHKNKDPQGTLNMLNDLSMYLLDIRKMEESLKIIDQAFDIYRRKHDTTNIDFAFLHSNKAYYYHLHSDFKKLAKHRQIQMDIITQIDKNHPLLVELYSNKMSNLLATNQLIDGLELADTALTLAKAQNLPYYTTLNYMNLANMLKFYEPYLALDIMTYTKHYALTYQRDMYINDPYFYINTGSCYVACDMPAEALQEFKTGLRVLKKQENPPVNFETALYYYIGVCYKNLNQYSEAAVYYDSTAQIYKGLFSKKHKGYLRNISMAANTLILAEKYDQALEILQETYPLVLEVYGFNDTYYTAQEGQNLAQCLLETGQYDAALKQYHQNISFFNGDTIPGNYYALPTIDTIGGGKDRTSLLLSYLGKAQSLEKIYETNNSDSILTNIIDHYQACAAVSDISANKGHLDQADTRVVAFHLRKLTNEAMDFIASNPLTQDQAQQIYKIVSKSKAYALLSDMYKSNIQNPKLGYLNALEDSIYQLESTLTNQMLRADNNTFEELTEKLLNKKLQAFIYKQTHPVKDEEFSIQKIHNIDNKNITDNIKENEVVLDIYLTKNNIVTFEIDANSFQYYTSPISEDIFTNIKLLQRNIKTSRNSETLAQQLYEQLLGKTNIQNRPEKLLTIIPDSYLFTIPFEVLRDASNQMIIENHATRYRYTSHLYASTQPVVETNTFLAVAPVFENPENELTVKNNFRNVEIDSLDIFRHGKFALKSLPYTVDETTELNNRFKSNNWQSTLLLNENANEENLKMHIKNKSIVHIATHGYADNKNSEFSGLFMAQTQDTTTEDNYLYMSEIYNMKINADLVVLSACQSGYGQIWQGEGILALPRAFLAGGTRNVISSLWKIHDQKTKDLMIRFYQALEDKNDYAKALRSAKLKMIKNNELPIDWSGFTLICN